MNSINVAACIVAFLLGVVLFTLANEIILKLPNNENIFKGKPKSFEKFSPRCLFIQILGGVFGVLMVWQFDVSLEAVTVFLFFALLTIITFIDADTICAECMHTGAWSYIHIHKRRLFSDRR